MQSNARYLYSGRRIDLTEAPMASTVLAFEDFRLVFLLFALYAIVDPVKVRPAQTVPFSLDSRVHSTCVEFHA